MAAIRSLLARAARLEQAKVSAFVRIVGSMDQFAAGVQAGIDKGTYDRRDMPSRSRASRIVHDLQTSN